MVPKVFEPLKFYCNVRIKTVKLVATLFRSTAFKHVQVNFVCVFLPRYIIETRTCDYGLSLVILFLAFVLHVTRKGLGTGIVFLAALMA